MKKRALKIERKMKAVLNKGKKCERGKILLTPRQSKAYFDLYFQLQKLQVIYLGSKMRI